MRILIILLLLPLTGCSTDPILPPSHMITDIGEGKWRVDKSTDDLTDENIVTAYLYADEGASRLGKDPYELIFRCRGTKADLYIRWHTFISSSDVHVTTRINEEKPVKYVWGTSTNHTATFFTNPFYIRHFARKIMTSSKLVARVAPYSESPITAVFDTRGAANAVKHVFDACGIK